MKRIRNIISESIKIKNRFLEDEAAILDIKKISEEITSSYQSGNKVFFCGNGGSAADAQHLAAELSGKFYLDRKPLFAEALHVNTSYITAVSNDYGFEEVYSRLVEAKCNIGDVLFAITTSGSSMNIWKAVETANKLKVKTILLSGSNGVSLSEICKHSILVPSVDTPRIQEMHILIGHIICEIVEEELFG